MGGPLYHREVAQPRNATPPTPTKKLELTDACVEHLIGLLESDLAFQEDRVAEGHEGFTLIRTKLLLQQCREIR